MSLTTAFPGCLTSLGVLGQETEPGAVVLATVQLKTPYRCQEKPLVFNTSHPAKEWLGTNPRVHTEEFLRDAFEVAGLPAAGQEGVDMVLRILQGTVKRDKNSLNNDSYEEDLANIVDPNFLSVHTTASTAAISATSTLVKASQQSEMQSSSSDVSAMDCNEFVQPGITETTPKSAPGELLTTSGPISIISMLDQLSNRIKEPRMEWITREDGMLEGLGTNPRVHTEEFLRDAFEVAGLPAAGQEGVDMVLRILQGTVKRDKNSLNNDSYEEDLANLIPLWNNKVILERIDRDNNKLASFTPIPGVCHCCKSNPAARGTSPKQVKVQSIVMPYYGLHGYWVVQMAPLAPYSPDPSLQLTEMQKASLQMLLADAFTSDPALKLSEELPPWILGCDFHHVDPRHRSGQKINERITWKDVVGEQNQDIGLGFNRKELGKTMVAYHKALQSRIMRMPFMVRQEIMKPRVDQEQQVNEKQKFRQLRDATLSRYAQTWTCVLWLTILVWKRIIETPFVQISSSLGASLEQFARMLKQKVGNSGPQEPTGIPLFDPVGDQGLDMAQLLSGDTNHEDEVDSEESSSESGDEDQESPVGPTHLLPVGSAAETGEELFAALLAVTESLFQAETVISTIPEKVFNNPLFTWWVIDSRDVLGAWRPANSVSRTGAALLRWAYVTGLHRFWQDCKVTGSVEPERLMQIGHFTSRFNRHTMSGRIG
ncbi:hypothetical protein BJ742DRAFT_852460 [Cladochytrium replicatum]|nr:hypothetical protein BJ742DRAFT_852460 [Cladochytrium replicatum]